MTPRNPTHFENVPAWLVDWSLMGMMPPRDPNDDDDDDDDDDAEDENGDVEPDGDPAVVREPDE